MAEQERKTARRTETQPDQTEANPTVTERGQKLKKDIDELLDEIDSVLENNAEEFVKNYVQRGGQSRAGRRSVEEWQLSAGEIHYVWWFIQGSIMEADIRWRLRRAWGMCPRHAWGALAAEAAFRHNYFHGPAILYQDLLERAVSAFRSTGPWAVLRLARRLRPTGPCMMCEMGFNQRSRGIAKPELVEEARDLTFMREFAERTRAYWRSTVCGKCREDASSARCRPHLAEEAASGAPVDVDARRNELAEILARLTVYSQSFRWESHNTDTERDRAALLSAIGWCTGWEGGLALFG
jgi:ubiquitin-like protein Pup